MKTVIAVTMIFCFFAMVSALSTDCANRATGVATCSSRIATATNSGNLASFCSECGNPYISYLNECANGAGVAQIKQRELVQIL